MKVDFLRHVFDLASVFRPKTNFEAFIIRNFKPGGRETARRVMKVMKDLQVPVPQSKKEFLDGTEGPLVFASRYGIVIRIEKKVPTCRRDISRVNNNPWILRPLATIDAGDALVEICPGGHTTEDWAPVRYLETELEKTGINFWDRKPYNVCHLAFSVPKFPEGVPLVCDRTGVSGLTKSLGAIKRALKEMGVMKDPQRQLYAPLRRTFREAWPEGAAHPDPVKMRGFWNLCAAFAREGKLVAGWEREQTGEDFFRFPSKATQAKDVAEAYGKKMKAFAPA